MAGRDNVVMGIGTAPEAVVIEQERNINTRSMGLDERILEVNRQVARECPDEQEYAEVFEYSSWE